MKHPNVLIFCADEMRAGHMACAGNALVKTPSLDRIARRGTLFRRAYCNNPICMPARHSLFTGLMPRDHGCRINGQTAHPGIPTLPGILASHGYRTHAAGKLHLTPWVPRVDPPDPDRFPECMEYWNNGLIDSVPTPYFGLDSVDLVGGHTSYAFGPYARWLEAQRGDRTLLTPDGALEPPSGAPSSYKMGLPEELHYNRFIADSTIRLIEDGEGDAARPFFAWCSFPDPHAPIAPPAPYCNMYDPLQVELPARREGEICDLPPVYRRIFDREIHPNGVDNRPVADAHWREMIALTYGMISHIDTEIGRVLDALDRTGQANDTIVVFTSDHGDMLGDHGLLWKAFYTFRGCINIPFLVAAPGMSGGHVSDALVCQIDLLPSILELCGIPGAVVPDTPFERGTVQPLGGLPGRSWCGLLDGTREAVRDDVVIENDSATTGYRVRALVTDRYRLAVYPGTEDGELFDLKEDPNELFNLWYKPTHRPLREGLRNQLLDSYSRTTPWQPIPPWNS